MAEPKTRPTKVSVSAFLATIEDEQKRKDSQELVRMMRSLTGARPVMWGPSIVGFGSVSITYANGKRFDWPSAAFSPRKQSLVVYIMPGFKGYSQLMRRLGKHSCGVSCLYIKRLDDVHRPTLVKLIKGSMTHFKNRNR